MARLQSMAAAQDLVTETGGRPVPLLSLVKQALTPFGLARFAASVQTLAPIPLLRKRIDPRFA